MPFCAISGSVAWPTRVQLVFFLCSGVSKLFGVVGQLTQLTQPVSPRFLFIMEFIMI